MERLLDRNVTINEVIERLTSKVQDGEGDRPLADLFCVNCGKLLTESGTCPTMLEETNS